MESEALHKEVVRSVRSRNDREHDIPDPAEFERFLVVLDDLAEVIKKGEAAGCGPLLVGRAMHFYSKCLAAATA